MIIAYVHITHEFEPFAAALGLAAMLGIAGIVWAITEIFGRKPTDPP